MLVQQTVRFLHSQKQPSILLKLDITKAFDSVSWPFLMEVLGQLGFGSRWRDLLCGLLTSSSTQVLLNGTPRKTFNYMRGVRQGDPLSPLLFVLAADLLQCIINKAYHQGLFELPIPSYELDQFPIVQYADDTLLILRASQRELFTLKGLLESFAQSTGLRVNYKKSCLVPLNLSLEKAQLLAGVFWL